MAIFGVKLANSKQQQHLLSLTNFGCWGKNQFPELGLMGNRIEFCLNKDILLLTYLSRSVDERRPGRGSNGCGRGRGARSGGAAARGDQRGHVHRGAQAARRQRPQRAAV